MKYVAPKRDQKSFTCPHCGVLARQYHYSNPYDLSSTNQHASGEPIATSLCEHCDQFVLWHQNNMVFPNRGNAPIPNPDMPADVKKDYEEAATISSLSPRGAAALLRLSIQKLCKHLGENGKNINDDITSLIKKGLSSKIQQALDIVRVVGNNAVHPGQLDLRDDIDTANNIFGLVNLITEVMITQPKHVENMYSTLVPEAQKKAIKKRNNT